MTKALIAWGEPNQMTANEQLTTNTPEGIFLDWFCKDSALPAKARKLLIASKQIAATKRWDFNQHYLLFKNNCPVTKPLYDDIRIVDLETRDVVAVIIPSKNELYLNATQTTIRYASWDDLIKGISL